MQKLNKLKPLFSRNEELNICEMLVSRNHVSRSLLQYSVLVPHVFSLSPPSSKKMVFSFFLAGKYSNNDPNSKINIEKLLNSCNRSFPFITWRLLFFVSETIA